MVSVCDMNSTDTLVTGNTYPVKDALKSLGGRWDPDAKGWRFADKVTADKARALLPAPTPRATTDWRTNPRHGYAEGGGRGPSVRNGLCPTCGDECGGTRYRCGYA